MNDEQTKKEENTDNNNAPQKNSDQKPRIKGSHRNGKPPKTKWV